MSPTGKGVIRIAIEDFFETFDVSNVAENMLGKFGGFMMNKVFGRYISLLDDMANVTQLPFLKSLQAEHSTTMTGFEKFSMVCGMVIACVLGMGRGLIEPYSKLLSYSVDKSIRTFRLPIATFLSLYRMYPNEAAVFVGDYQEQGVSSERIQAMLSSQNTELGLGNLLTLYWRGFLSESEYIARAYKSGIDAERAKDFINAMAVIPNVNDIVRMAVREAFSEDIVQRFQYDEGFPTDILQYTDKQGLSKDWVMRYWRTHWEIPGVSLGYEMLHRLRPGRTTLEFTDTDLDLLLRTGDYAPYFRPRMKEISYNTITRVDIRRLYKLGLFDAQEVKERYMDIGYNDKDAGVLADFTVKYEDEQGNDKRTKYKDLTLSVFNSLYKKGKLTELEYHNKVAGLGYDEDEIKLLLDYLDIDNTDTIAIDYKKGFVSDMTKSAINAYSARMIDKSNATIVLQALGINAVDIGFMLQSADYNADLDDLNLQLKYIKEARISGAITRDTTIGLLGQLGISGLQQNKVIEDMELSLKYRNKRLSEAQYRLAVNSGIITQEEYKENLIGLGYTDYDIDVLIALYFA